MLLNFSLQLLKTLLERAITIHRRIPLDLLQNLPQMFQFPQMRVRLLLDQIITIRAIDATLLPVVLVLLATIATSTLDVLPTRTLPVRSALHPHRTHTVAIAALAAFRRESVLERFAFVASQSGDAWFAVALAGVQVAGDIDRTDRIAVAGVATFAASDVVISELASVAVASVHVRLTAAGSRNLVADRDAVFALFGCGRVAFAFVAVAFRQLQGVAVISCNIPTRLTLTDVKN